jgi:mannosyltransferase
VGFALRVPRLDYQSLWYDETYSVHIARGSLAAVGAVPEAEPLTHYYLLWLWVRGAGWSEYGVRYLSVLAGVLTLALLYQTAKLALRRRWLAVFAAGLLAVSPFHVSYSQEARLHVFAGLLAVAATYTFLVALKRGTWRAWLLYTLTAIAGLYTSYYSAFLLAALNMPVLVRREWSRRWFVANATAIALSLPGVALAFARLRAFSEPYPVIQALLAPGYFLLRTPANLLFWGLPATAAAALGLIAIALILAGAWRLFRSRKAEAAVLACGGVVTYVAVFAIPAALGLSYYDRYELLALPSLLAVLAAGCWWVGSRMRWTVPVLAGGLLAAAGIGLFNGYTDPGYQRDDNRAAIGVIRQQALPDEIVIYDLPLLYTVFEYYGQELPVPTKGLPVAKNPDLPIERQFVASTSDRAATEVELARLSQQYGGFWLFLTGDPTHWTEDWLDANRLPVTNRWFGGTRLKHYRPLPSDGRASLADGRRTEKNFGPLRLREVRPEELKPGKLWPVRLAWEAAAAPSVDYTVSLQLFDQEGARVAQTDAQPFEGALPTSQWQAGKAYQDVAMLPLPERLAPGAYRLDVSVYKPGGSAAGQQQAAAVVPYGLAAIQVPEAQASAGWTVDRLSLGRTPTGGYLVLLEGSVQSEPAADYTWFVHLLGDGGQLRSQDDHPPLTPTSAWRQGDRFAEAFALAPASGAATLEIGAYDVAGRSVTYTAAGLPPADHILLPLS